jgi:hypothetical protein
MTGYELILGRALWKRKRMHTAIADHGNPAPGTPRRRLHLPMTRRFSKDYLAYCRGLHEDG